MPELPDVTVYCEAIDARVRHQRFERVRVLSPFFVRTFDPPVDSVQGRRIDEVRRLGKRIVLKTDTDLFIVIHLMIAGRFRWLKPGAIPPRKITLAAFDFADGTLAITEAGTKKRASLHVVSGGSALARHDPGGLEILDCDLPEFSSALRCENHTLKRALTDPRLFSGIGNAYSDEILHAARLSPVALSQRLTPRQVAGLYEAARSTLNRWIEILRRQFAGRFPGAGDITAFRPDFAVHGKYGRPCPVCAAPIQRIRYVENETNYCPRCQTQGRILADRSLSRLLKDDWPSSIDELDSL